MCVHVCFSSGAGIFEVPSSLHLSWGAVVQELPGMRMVLTAACSSVWMRYDSRSAVTRRGRCLVGTGTS